MTAVIESDAPPIRVDANGAWRFGNSRLLVELVVDAFQDGATPEAIVQRYPVVTLADVYGVIAYYLRHPGTVGDYLAEREAVASQVRDKIERGQTDMKELRRRLVCNYELR